MNLRILAYFAFLVGISSCARRSYIYSPSLNLGDKQMESGQISVGVIGGLLPETSPESAYNERWVAPAGGLSVRLGITDYLELRAETWADLSENDAFYRGSSAFSLVYKINKEGSDWSYFVIPKYGFVNLYSNNSSTSSFSFSGIQGHGLSLSLAVRKASKGKIKPYFGLSGLMGFSNWQANPEPNSNGNFRNKNGQALVLHGGVSMKFNDYISFSGEIPLIFQIDQFNQQYYIFPTLNLGLEVRLGKLWKQ